jgi:hypothetical protein
MTTRRRFLKTGAVFVVAAGVPLKTNNIVFGQRAAVNPSESGVFELPLKSQLDPLFNLRKSSFEAYLNSIFQVRVRNGLFFRNVSLTLIAVDDARAWSRVRMKGGKLPVDNTGLDSFSLQFRGSNRTRLSQDVYDVQHPALGKISVLLVPILGKDSGAAYYEVIINRATH